MLTIDEYRTQLREKLSFYGIWNSVITNEQVGRLHANGYSVDDAFGVASDMANGFTFDEALTALNNELLVQANKEEE